MGILDKVKKSIKKEPDAQWVRVEEPELTEEQKVERARKSLQAFSIVGEDYPCRKDKKVMRRNVERGIKIGSKVTLEKFTYQKEPAYMVINPLNGMDIGVLSSGAAWRVANATKKKVLQGEIADQHIDAARRHHWGVYIDEEGIWK